MSELTYEEKRKIERYLCDAGDYERDSALSSRGGFFSWLRGVGLAYIVGKVIDLAWAAIKVIFFPLF